MRKFIPIFVFVIYINDLEDYLLDRNLTGPSSITEGIKTKCGHVNICALEGT